jgi:hypothetical protein
MKQKIDQRSATKKAKDAVYAALPIAYFTHPLKFIRNNDGKMIDDPKQGKVWEDGKYYHLAHLAAEAGLGNGVTRIARFLVKH